MMASTSTAVRLAALSSRVRHVPSAAAAATNNNYYSSSSSLLPSPNAAASQNTVIPKRSHHHHIHASSPSTQLFVIKSQWNGCSQMMTSSLPSLGHANSCSNANDKCRWFSSKSDKASSSHSQQQATNNNNNDTISGSSQHNTWVEFQKSIAVTGFETGQTVREQTFGKKSRGGKIDRKRKEREAELEAALRGVDTTQVRIKREREKKNNDREYPQTV